MKKIIVNEDACIGCGACVSIDPDHFEFNDEGLSRVTNNEDLESNDLANAISSCPTGAILIEEVNDDEEAKESNWECGSGDCAEGCSCGCNKEDK